MYRIVYYRYNIRRSQKFKTISEALDFLGQLTFESFSELYKIES